MFHRETHENVHDCGARMSLKMQETGTTSLHLENPLIYLEQLIMRPPRQVTLLLAELFVSKGTSGVGEMQLINLFLSVSFMVLGQPHREGINLKRMS